MPNLQLPEGEDDVKKIDSTRAPTSSRHKKESRPETLVQGRFQLHKKLGEGSFGMVFLGVDSRSNKQVAIKLEHLKSSAAGQLGNESRLLDMLSRPARPQGFVEVHYYGKENSYAILVMDRLGYSFEDAVQVVGGKMSPPSCAIAAEQGIKLISYLHSKSIVHRDIKSENFMWGLGTKVHHLYMIDFGMSTRFFVKKHVNLSAGKDMTGTARYASINAMKGYTQSRRDDLESWAHVLIYALRGSVPWSGLDAPTYKDKLRLICETKASFPIPELCKGFPKEFSVFLGYSRKLGFEEKPNYEALMGSFRDYRLSQDPPVQEYELEWLDPKKVDFESLEPLTLDEPLAMQPEDVVAQGGKTTFSG